MRVTLCVDALGPQLTGIGRYTWELCRRLQAHSEISELHYYARRRLIDDPARLLRGQPIYPGHWPRRLLRRMQAKRVLNSTLAHGPNFFLPPEARTGVITVHDLSVLRFPETHPPARVEQFERLLTDSIIRVAHVITDTEMVRDEVIAEFSLRPDRVTAIPLGVDPTFRPLAGPELQVSLDKWGLSVRGYALCVATLEPRKKISELIQSWRLLPAPMREAYPLVIAGGTGWRNEGLLAEIASAEAEGWVRNLGFVANAPLPQLYAGAALFIYPSVYEGFGLPPLEAMACGTPVLASNRTCLAEVCADAANYFDPDDIEGTASLIECSLSDARWLDGARLRGLARSRQFSWERCVDKTVEVYRRASAASSS